MSKIILISFVVFLICLWQRNNLADLPIPQGELMQEPSQSKSFRQGFQVLVGQEQYDIEPKYDYELYGLVVSYRHHDGDYGLHSSWGDYLNIADVCVVWSDNAFNLDLTEFDFWNGQFTCNIKTSSNQAWRQFRGDQLSNNHLITENTYLQDKIRELSIGDQIHIKGMLAHYSGNNGSYRGTSTTRTDTGNGACETIYVEEFNVLHSYISPWRYGMYASLLVLILSLVIYFQRPHRV